VVTGQDVQWARLEARRQAIPLHLVADEARGGRDQVGCSIGALFRDGASPVELGTALAVLSGDPGAQERARRSHVESEDLADAGSRIAR